MGNDRKRKELRRAKRKERAAIKKARPRECGECTACCTALAIPEVPTLVGEHCTHECAEGCAIYAMRPSRCRNFECMWIGGWGAKPGDRPDRLGWLGYVDRYPEFNMVAGGGSKQGTVLIVRETTQGALQEPRFAEALRDWLRRGSAVLVQERSETGEQWVTLYGPKIPKGVRVSRDEMERNATAPSRLG